MAFGQRDDNFLSHGSDSGDEFTEDLHFGLETAELAGKDGACFVEDFVSDAQVFVRFIHSFTDVEGGTIEFPFEEVQKLVLEDVHLIGVTELVVVACQVTIGHNTVEEVVNEQLHFGVTAELVIERSVLVNNRIAI